VTANFEPKKTRQQCDIRIKNTCHSVKKNEEKEKGKENEER
jgi:hypothetical protein